MNEQRIARGVLDTSVFVAVEQGRSIREEALPEAGVASIVTIAELRAGVLAAPDVESRNRRITTLEGVMKAGILPITEHVARAWAGMRTYLVASERKVTVNDLWIAATAAACEIPVVTQDRDYHALSGVGGLTVVEV